MLLYPPRNRGGRGVLQPRGASRNGLCVLSSLENASQDGRSRAMLSNEPLEGLPFPQSRMQQLFVALDFGFPLVITRISSRQGNPGLASSLSALEKLH